MQLLRLLFLASVQLWVSNAQGVVSNCQIMNIAPNDINGFAQCGYGSLSAGCVCCGGPQGDVACQSPTETCTMGISDYYCVESPGYTTSSCASSGQVTCGTICMPVGGSCCPSGIQYCLVGFSCDSQNNCIENSSPPTSTSEFAATSTTESTTESTATSHTSATQSVAGAVNVSSASTWPWNPIQLIDNKRQRQSPVTRPPQQCRLVVLTRQQVHCWYSRIVSKQMHYFHVDCGYGFWPLVLWHSKLYCIKFGVLTLFGGFRCLVTWLRNFSRSCDLAMS